MATQTVVGTLYKDPNEIRTFYMDWSAHIGVNQIVSSQWSVDVGVEVQASGILSGGIKTHVTLSGGTPGASYHCTNTITLSTGEVYEKTGLLGIRQQ